MQLKKVDSVRKRYLVTLFSNVVLFMASIVTAGIVPRALGPKELGDFGFLNRVSSSFRNMLDMGTSSAFFNLNSKEEKTGSLVKAYSLWFLFQLVLIISLIILAFLIGIKDLIWPGQELKYIVWVAVFDWVFFSASLLRQLGDSKGHTTNAQLINLVISILNIVVLVFFALKGFLNIGFYIAIQIFSSALISLFIMLFVIAPHRDIYWDGKITDHLKGTIKYFKEFCSPLVMIMIVSFIFEYFDRMFLQRFGGSVEQGYFHIASSWATFSTLFTASFLSIYKREVAYSLGGNDKLRASEIFSKYIKMLYFITLTLAVLLAFNAKELLELIAGPKFTPATMVLFLMAFYPIHQVYGQLGGATFYSTERTKALRNIQIVGMLLGIGLTYLFLAPSTLLIPGLGMGSVGLAFKTVLLNIIIVQVYLVSNCRYFKISPKPFWVHQIYTVLILFVLMVVLKWAVFFFIGGVSPLVIFGKLALLAFLYFVLIFIMIYFFPHIAGLKKEEIDFVLDKIKAVLRFKKA